IYGVNRAAGAVRGGRSRVEKIWRVEREREIRVFFPGFGEGLLYALSYIANLTSLLSSLRKILENLYCLSKRGVAVHPKVTAMAKKRRESSARAKSSSATSVDDPKVDKSSPEKDAGVSNLLKTNFLSRKQHFIYFKKEVVEDVADQTGGVVESMSDQADAEKTTDQASRSR
ncbi:unnamed protein product, partial [Prunus brigantina]